MQPGLFFGGLVDPRPKPAYLVEAIALGETTLALDEVNVRPNDVIVITDPYPGQRDYLDYATSDRAVVVGVDGPAVEIRPLDEEFPIRAHVVDAQVVAISRAVTFP